ncbi:hypothetical protein ACFL00_02800 [Pseudomonadota bacterium]
MSFGQGLEGVPGVTLNPAATIKTFTPEGLSEEMEHHVDGVIGAEILRTQTLTIDPTEYTVSIVEFSTLSGLGVPLRDQLNVPIVDVEFYGQTIPTIFDTGAWLGYVPRAITEGLQPVRTAQDFYPLYGKFRCDVYEIPIRIGNWNTVLDFGVLPYVIEQAHHEQGFTTIVGLGLLNEYKISISLKVPRMRLLPLH